MTVTGIGAERQGGDGRLPPADDGRLTPEHAAQLLFDDPRATVNFEARHGAEALSAVEEFARLLGRHQEWSRTLSMAPKRVRKRYRLVRHQKADPDALRKDRANASPK